MSEKVFLIKNWFIMFSLANELWYNTLDSGRQTVFISLSFINTLKPDQKECAKVLSFILLNLNIKIGKIELTEKPQ